MRCVNRKLAVYRRYSTRMDAVVLYWYYRRRRKIRRYWQHPLMAQRSTEGAYSLLMSQLRGDESKFFNYFRMSMSTFDELLKLLEKDLKKQDTRWRKSICLEEKLAIFLSHTIIFVCRFIRCRGVIFGVFFSLFSRDAFVCSIRVFI
ncbi:unnamed protein product [Acanthoscelides obtectus]|uniref:Uncharacterized protein n=1 Tax=Acanthoscelides obtectus TaxID=200917 RepID=A0A9P0LSD2_ACAOB|nr:unnamed protein product [Acanthoscelides obtectus]CAK1686329.1 hypothetical protein AOBTE_LOCUS35927 [Acanthoscelides obtectus]